MFFSAISQSKSLFRLLFYGTFSIASKRSEMLRTKEVSLEGNWQNWKRKKMLRTKEVSHEGNWQNWTRWRTPFTLSFRCVGGGAYVGCCASF
jgi:hypothetical protein